jgi:proline iminopeptidase
MKIKILARGKIPACELNVEIMKLGKKKLGKGRPVMLMLPGGPGGNHTVYDEIKSSLFLYADLVLVDPRGCGLSSPSEARFCTMEESVNDIEALRLELGVDYFILFGGSYGAMVSLSYAVAYNDKLLCLILVAGAASGQCFNTALETIRKIGTEEQVVLTKRLFDGTVESVEEKERYYSMMQNIYLAKETDLDSKNKKAIPTIGKQLPCFLELSNFGHSDILPNYNIVDKLYKITTPTLLLAGQRDWINDVKYAHQMNQLIVNSHLVVFPEAGHFVWKGIESQFFSAINEFLQSMINRGRAR